MPAADDLFRPTAPPEDDQTASGADQPAESAESSASDGAERRRRSSSGRVRHDEKMTVYLTAEELIAVEHARLSLRRDLGVAVDRGRLVREALAITLADLETNGEDSDLVKRLLG